MIHTFSDIYNKYNKEHGDIDKSFNVDFSNQSGLNIAASYDLNNSLLKGNVSKYTDIGNTGYSVGVGVDYNDGNIGPSFQIRKDFKKGGLLDKKRGWQNLIRGV